MENIKELKYDDGFGWYTGNVFINLFDKDIEVIIEEGADIDYAEKCISDLNNLSPILTDKIIKRIYEYYEFVKKEFDDVEDIKFDDIMQHICPLTISITKPKTLVSAFAIECTCDWEEEHGMEIIVKEDELLYVGEYTGLGPWADEKYYKCAF